MKKDELGRVELLEKINLAISREISPGEAIDTLLLCAKYLLEQDLKRDGFSNKCS